MADTQGRLNLVKLMQETSVVHPHRTLAYHGETISFQIAFSNYGKPVDLTGATATVYWRVPDDEEGHWHTAEGAVDGSAAAWQWTPDMDAGGNPVTWFLQVALNDSNDAISYRATGELKLLASPGFVPAILPPATATLDFDTLTVLNAPYYTQGQTDAAIAAAVGQIPAPPVTSVNGDTGAVVVTAQSIGALPLTGGEISGDVAVSGTLGANALGANIVQSVNGFQVQETRRLTTYGWQGVQISDSDGHTYTQYSIALPLASGTFALTSDITPAPVQSVNSKTGAVVLDGTDILVGGASTIAQATVEGMLADFVVAIGQMGASIGGINNMIPSAATSSNKLADQAWVATQISNAVGTINTALDSINGEVI